MKRIDQNVALAIAIDFELTDEDLRNIDVDVAIAEAAAFEIAEGECGDQSITEEEIAEMAMAAEEDEQNIDPSVYMEDGVSAGWADIIETYNIERREDYDAFIKEQHQASRVPIINEDLHNDAFWLFSSN